MSGLCRSTVVDHLFESFNQIPPQGEKADPQQDTAVLYIYCNYKERVVQTPVNIVASLLAQLIRYMSIIPKDLREYYDQFQKIGLRPDLKDLSSVLQDQLKTCSRAFIIVDALDEYSDRDAARAVVTAVLLNLQKHANLMVTSRKLPSITDTFVMATQVEIRAQEADLRIYLDEEVGLLAPCVRRKSELKALVIESIVTAVDGMFLLAQLYVRRCYLDT